VTATETAAVARDRVGWGGAGGIDASNGIAGSTDQATKLLAMKEGAVDVSAR
jgi:hypothetical protein